MVRFSAAASGRPPVPVSRLVRVAQLCHLTVDPLKIRDGEIAVRSVPGWSFDAERPALVR